jgi:predicted amidohydrolase
MIVSPSGEVLAVAETEGEQIVLADLDQAERERVVAGMPLLDHRRPGVYPEEVHA